MSTFEQLITKTTGVGVAYLVEVSTDRFSTVDYRWGTVAGKLDGTNEADARLVSLGAVNRGLAPSGLASSTTSIVLSNSDGGVDWLVSRATVESTVLKARFRLTLCVWDALAPSDSATKTLGVFTCLNYPRRDGARVLVDLADEALSDAVELARAPSVRDWANDAGTNSTNAPIFPSINESCDWDAPTPVAFNTVVPCPIIGVSSTKAYAGIMLCATTDTAAVSATDVTTVDMKVPGANPLISSAGWVSLPQQYTKGGLTVSLWAAKKTQSLTSDGKTWSLIWAVLYLDNLRDYLVKEAFIAPLTTVTTNGFVTTVTTRDFVGEILAGSEFRATGFPLSGRSYYGSTVRLYGQSAPAIVYDLLSSYSRDLTLGDVDATSFGEVVAAYPTTIIPSSYYSGGWKPSYSQSGSEKFQVTKAYPSGQLKEAIEANCKTGMFEVFIGWDGKFHAIASNIPYGATVEAIGGSARSLDELLAKGIADRIPSAGERWAPYNRVFIKALDSELPWGPIDDTAAISAWGRVLTRNISIQGHLIDSELLAWLNTEKSINFYGFGWLESKVRPILSFTYPLEAVLLELGDYFTFTWSRGGLSAPYTDTLFRVEALRVNPLDCTVDVTAVWMGNLQEDVPFLLDDEAYITRVAATLGRTATVTDGSDTVTFASGDLVADGVVAGDVLVLQDSTQADDVFTRFRAIRIVSVDSATNLSIDGTDTGFGADAVAGLAVADWTIYAGATTYPTAASDVTNYPDGGWMYGKATSDADIFSGAIPDGLATDAGNKLMDG